MECVCNICDGGCNKPKSITLDRYETDCGFVSLLEENGDFVVLFNGEEIGRGCYEDMEHLYFDTIEDHTYCSLRKGR